MTGDIMEFPETFKEFARKYRIVDSKQVYTNGAELIPTFRVEQWLENMEHRRKSVDRNTLLKLAYYMERQSKICEEDYIKTGEPELAGEYSAYRDCSRRICEALGI